MDAADPAADTAPDPWADPARFGQVFQLFLDTFVNTATRPTAVLAGVVQDEIGIDPLTAPVTSRGYPAYELANVNLGVTGYVSGHEVVRVLGISGAGREYRSFTDLVTDGGFGGFRASAVEYRTVTVGVDEEMTCVACGLWLVKHGPDAVPVALMLRADDPNDPNTGVKLDVMTADPATADEVLSAIEAEARDRDVLRGKVMSIQPPTFGDSLGPMQFHSRPALTAADLVLPEGLLDLVERQVIGIARHREVLRSQGQHLRRGVLLHGPPGTGKTLTVRYLLGQAAEFTVLLITGPAIKYLGAACALARRLEPALVVIEDVDLVAEDRMMAEGPQPLLFQMLDELDGLDDDSDVAFLLTTNRVEVLERALVERPGRIDVAVEVPLPDDVGRRTLFRLYGSALAVTEAELDAAADACAGVTASFVKECVRRAVLIAAERGASAAAGEDLRRALAELIGARDELAGRLLGGDAQARHGHSSADLGGYC